MFPFIYITVAVFVVILGSFITGKTEVSNKNEEDTNVNISIITFTSILWPVVIPALALFLVLGYLPYKVGYWYEKRKGGNE